jgi:hypothetical protein
MPGPQQALSAALACWNAGDLDGYLSLYDEGIRLHGYSPEPMDKVQVRGFYEATSWCTTSGTAQKASSLRPGAHAHPRRGGC